MTYHGSEQFKSQFVEQVENHERADRYAAGYYGEKGGAGFTGCSVGCSIHSLQIMGKIEQKFDHYGDYSLLAERLGWPLWLVLLQEQIFERMESRHRTAWTPRLARAVPVGREIEAVRFWFLAFLMGQSYDHVAELDIPGDMKSEALEILQRTKRSCNASAISGKTDSTELDKIWEQVLEVRAKIEVRAERVRAWFSPAFSVVNGAMAAVESVAEIKRDSVTAAGSIVSVVSVVAYTFPHGSSQMFTGYASKLIELLEDE